MKILKLVVMAIIGIASCMSISSCSDDGKDDPNGGQSVNPSKVFINGMPKQVGGMVITCGESGRVNEIRDTDEDVYVLFDYESYSRSENYDLCMTINDGGESGSDDFHIQLNDAGFAKYCKQIEGDGDVEEWWFEYNSDGQLVKMKRSEGGNEVTEIAYLDGNITSVKMRSEDDGDGDDYAIEYGTPLVENKGCIMMWDECFGIDMDEMKYAYFAGLLGMPTKNLPTVCKYKNFDPTGEWENEWVANFTWSLNENGMPTKLVTKTADYDETTIFNW
jgi:hypothetical protein